MAEKEFDKIQQPYIIKINAQGNRSQNIHKKNPTVNIIFNDEMLSVLSTLATSIQHFIQVLSYWNKTRKINKRHTDWKEEIKTIFQHRRNNYEHRSHEESIKISFCQFSAPGFFSSCCLFVLVWFFWSSHMACRILVPQPGIKLGAPAVWAPSPNHWTTKEFPVLLGFESVEFELLGRFLDE